MSIEFESSDVDILQLELTDGRTLGQVMTFEAKRLKYLLDKYLKDALENTIWMYAWGTRRRTGNLLNSLTVNLNPVYNKSTGEITITAIFNDSLSGASMFGIGYKKESWNTKIGDLGKYNLALLIDQGYRVKKEVWFKNIYNFGYRHGTDFIQDAINEFNRTNSLGIYIDRQNDVFLV